MDTSKTQFSDVLGEAKKYTALRRLRPGFKSPPGRVLPNMTKVLRIIIVIFTLIYISHYLQIINLNIFFLNSVMGVILIAFGVHFFVVIDKESRRGFLRYARPPRAKLFRKNNPFQFKLFKTYYLAISITSIILGCLALGKAFFSL